MRLFLFLSILLCIFYLNFNVDSVDAGANYQYHRIGKLQNPIPQDAEIASTEFMVILNLLYYKLIFN